MPASVGIDAATGVTHAAFLQGARQPKFVERSPEVEPGPVAAPALVFDPSGRAGVRPVDRVEASGETPLIGCGIDWPPAAGFGGGAACPRVPVALALAHACSSTAVGPECGWPVERHIDGTVTRVPPEEVVGHFLRRVDESRMWTPEGEVPKCVLAVPNAMPLRAMTGLIRASGGKRLIWRPVAGLIDALRFETLALSEIDEDDHVLVVHLGTDGYEASLLHVIERKRDRGPALRVPGRPRFRDGETNVGAPFAGVLRRMAERRAFGTGIELGEAWARCWVQRGQAPAGTTEWPVGPWAGAEGRPDGSGWGWFRGKAQGDVVSEHRVQARNFRDRVVQMARTKGRVRALVLTGDLSESMRDLADAIGSDLRLTGIVDVGAAGPARGAAMFGWRESMGWPTYLDYLPQLRLFAESDGEPGWHEVVRSDWIDAGDRHVDTRQGFRLRRGAPGERERPIDLAVTLEGELHVKETQDRIELPASQSDEEVRLSIRIEVQAATGEPRVTATPIDVPSPPQVTLDWAIAKSTDQTPDQYIESRPRAFPPIESVHAAPWWSREEKYRLISLSDDDRRAFPTERSSVTPCDYVRFTIGTRLTLQRLRKIRAMLIRRYWDRDAHRWTGAVGLDGKVMFQQEVLDSLQKRLWDLYSSPDASRARADAPNVADAVKVLAWTGFSDRRFEASLLKDLDAGSPLGLYGCGNGIRTPDGCRRSILHLASRMGEAVKSAKREGRKLTRVNEPLRQLAWTLATRDVATSKLTDDEAHHVLFAVTNCAYLLHHQNSRKVMFQWSIRCLVLLLGRRRYASEFVAPGSPSAQALIEFCADVYFAVADSDEFGRSIGAELGKRVPRQAEDPNPKVAQFIRSFFEYINRRGSGSIIVDDDDDSEDDG